MLNPMETPEKKGLMRLPPVNEDAEQALLGALLHNNEALERVSEFLRPEHFANPVNGRVFEAISKLCNQGRVADPIILKDFFSKDELLKEAGGVDYLIHLVDSVVSIINTEHYGRLIRDLHMRRKLIDVGETIVNDAHDSNIKESAEAQIENAEKQLFDLAMTGENKTQFASIGDALKVSLTSAEAAFKRDSHVVGITTGLKDLDMLLGGLHPSDLLIIAGRPSMGKTGLGTNIAFSAALASTQENAGGGSVAFFSLEMSSDQLATRILSHEAKISSDKIRRGELRQDDFPKLIEASRKISALPLYIDDTPALTVAALRTRARRLKRQKGLDLIVIDYLQLMQGKSSEGRVQEISEISRGLKALAKELQIPVIALSQLSRAVEQRDDKRPMLSDLRESGSIEQDADVVMFIYREEYYLSRQEPDEGAPEKYATWQDRMEKAHNLADIIVAKQRHGPIGTVQTHFDGQFTKFSNRARPQELQGRGR
jgi:replicative DNA helicase